MIEARMYEKGDVFRGDWYEPPSKSLEMACMAGVSLVLREGEEILAILIANRLWEGIWTVAMQPSKKLQEFPIAVVKEVKRAISTLGSYHKVRKLYTIMDTSNPTYLRWIEFLGFSEEYTMKDAGPCGQDMAGYSMIMEVD